MSLPVHAAVRPSELQGQSNGRLDTNLLYAISGGFLLHNASIAWNAMAAHAERDGVYLAPSSVVDTYRPWSWQDKIFRERYDHVPRSLSPIWYDGLPWWKKPNVATAAVPGTSNHGWGIAIDVADASGHRLNWLLEWAWHYGFSWEIQSEAWHLRYCLGDALPAGVFGLPTPTPLPPPPDPPQTDEEDFDMITKEYYPTRRAGTPQEDPIYDFTLLAAEGETRGRYRVESRVLMRLVVARDTQMVVTMWCNGEGRPVAIPNNGTVLEQATWQRGFCSVGSRGMEPTEPAIGLIIEARELWVPQ